MPTKERERVKKLNAVSIEFVNGKDPTFTPYPVHKLLITDFDHKIICKLILDIRSSALYNSPSQEIMELCDQYDSVLLSILDKHAPLRTKIITLRPNGAWYSEEFRKQKSTCRKLERR